MERQTVNLAAGRLFKMMSRPFQPGDIEDFYRCRGIIMGAVGEQPTPYRPNYARDRLLGAQGDAS